MKVGVDFCDWVCEVGGDDCDDVCFVLCVVVDVGCVYFVDCVE